MKTIFLDLDNLIAISNSLSITIGAYDGIHKGHLAVLRQLVIKKCSDETAVLTFDSHPDYLLKKSDNLGLINTIKEKEELFESIGIDYLIVLPKGILSKTAEEFHNILKCLNVRRIVVGSDFIYGANKSGNLNTLRKDFIVDEINLVSYENKKISSSDIRTLLSQGLFNEANKLLLKKFEVIGKVVHGSNIGGVLGFRTANLNLGEKYHNLLTGVYKVYVEVDEVIYLGIANYGVNPTCNEIEKPRLEVHILDFNEDIYGKDIKVIFDRYLRGEKRFSSKKELIEQINKDILNIKE